MRAGRRIRRRGFTLAAITTLSLAHGCREPEPPVVWTASIEGPKVVASGSVVRVRVDARPTDDWYFYSVTQPAGGPIPARIWLADSASFKLEGAVTSPPPGRTFDSIFGIDVEKYSAPASFIVLVRVPVEMTVGKTDIRLNASYQACNDTVCLSPRTVSMAVPLTIERY